MEGTLGEDTAKLLTDVSGYLGIALNALLLVRAAIGAEQARRLADRLAELGALDTPEIEEIRAQAEVWARSKHWRQSAAAVSSGLAVVGGATTIAAAAGVVTAPAATVGAGATALAAIGSLGLGCYKLYRHIFKGYIGEDDHARRVAMAERVLTELERGDPRTSQYADTVALLGALDVMPTQLVQRDLARPGRGTRQSKAVELIVVHLQSW